MHGHAIRREAERMNVGNWGGVSPGALYRELRRVEEEGFIEPTRVEQEGLRPTRTIYQITGAGQTELEKILQECIAEVHGAPDVLGMALVFGQILDRDRTLEMLHRRRSELTAMLSSISEHIRTLTEMGVLSPIGVTMFRRRELQLEAELRWQDEFEDQLGKTAD